MRKSAGVRTLQAEIVHSRVKKARPGAASVVLSLHSQDPGHPLTGILQIE
jgi:hypothetical protein